MAFVTAYCPAEGNPMNSLRISHPVPLASLLILACVAAGQAAPSSANSKSAPTTTSTVLHATTTLVTVDVVVTDHGKPVSGIDRSHFHVFEDGREQVIASFDDHQPPKAPANAIQLAARIATLPPHTYTNASPYPDTGAVNVLLLDALNTSMADQAEARKEMIETLGKIPPGTPIAIFTLASHLQLVTGFTTDAAHLVEVMKSKSAAPSKSVVTENQANSQQLELENRMGDLEAGSMPPPPDYLIAMQEFENDLTAVQTNLRVQVTLDAFQELARYLSGIPGRKNVIWFSGSFPITIDPDPNSSRSNRDADDYGAEIRRTGALLTAARAAVYPVDSRGLTTPTTTDASYTPSTYFMKDRNPMSKDYTTYLNQTAEEHSSMETVAEETGGKALFNSNDLNAAVTSAIEDGSSYYTISYVPVGLKLDGSFHRIKVTEDNGKDKLAYRDGYYADPGYGPGSGVQNPEGAKLITSAVLHGAPPSTQILLEARALPATDPLLKNANLPTGPAGQMAADIKGPPRLYVIDLSIDPHGITFNDAANGSHYARIEFLLVGYDAGGNRVNYLDKSLNVTLQPKQFESCMKSGLHARMFLDLPAGPGSLRIAVQDLNEGRVGSLEVSLESAN
jgi:VWFA-related protein